MGQVAVTVNGRSYKIACDDGQEPHVEKLAAYLNDRASELAAELGRREGESLVLVLAGLLVVDELADARAELSRIQPSESSGGKESEAAATGLAALADRIESIAERLAAP